MVYLRKIRPQILTSNEVNNVKSSVPKELDAKVDVKKNMITIYLREDRFA
jgi:hypothetical protein